LAVVVMRRLREALESGLKRAESGC
jgi:hypothetical protein